MLKSIAAFHTDRKYDVVAWRDIDHGPTDEKAYFTPSGQRNIEQTKRRALRLLERRGLVALGRYVFHPDDPFIPLNPDRHQPGKTRIITGARLTEAGWTVAKADEAARAADRP